MKSMATAATMLVALAACRDRQPLEPPSADVDTPVNEQQTQEPVNDARAHDVITDLRARVLPTLSPSGGLSSLTSALRDLAVTSKRGDAAATRHRLAAVRFALNEYERDAAAEHRPDLDAIRVAIEHIAER